MQTMKSRHVQYYHTIKLNMIQRPSYVHTHTSTHNMHTHFNGQFPGMVWYGILEFNVPLDTV